MGGWGGCSIDKGIEAGIERRHTNQNRANVIGRMPQKASAACKELETYSAQATGGRHRHTKSTDSAVTLLILDKLNCQC